MKIVSGRAEPAEVAPAIRELLERRAERLRTKPADTSQEAVAWVAEFPVGEDRYAIPLDALVAVMPLKLVTPVPIAPAHVIGIVRFRGQILTAMSLSSLLGVRGWRADPAVLLVVDVGGGRLVAIDCEQIPQANAIAPTAIEQARARQHGAVIEVTAGGADLHSLHLIADPALLVEAGDRTGTEASDGR